MIVVSRRAKCKEARHIIMSLPPRPWPKKRKHNHHRHQQQSSRNTDFTNHIFLFFSSSRLGTLNSHNIILYSAHHFLHLYQLFCFLFPVSQAVVPRFHFLYLFLFLKKWKEKESKNDFAIWGPHAPCFPFFCFWGSTKTKPNHHGNKCWESRVLPFFLQQTD